LRVSRFTPILLSMNANTNPTDTTKFLLLTAFALRLPITLRGVKFTSLNSLQHEDGSTRNFNVTGNLDMTGIDVSKLDKDSPLRSGVATIFVKTID
jgi:hypothetical protein